MIGQELLEFGVHVRFSWDSINDAVLCLKDRFLLRLRLESRNHVRSLLPTENIMNGVDNHSR